MDNIDEQNYPIFDTRNSFSVKQPIVSKQMLFNNLYQRALGRKTIIIYHHIQLLLKLDLSNPLLKLKSSMSLILELYEKLGSLH